MVQFNDGGSTFGGDGGFIYDKTEDHAALDGAGAATINQTLMLPELAALGAGVATSSQCLNTREVRGDTPTSYESHIALLGHLSKTSSTATGGGRDSHYIGVAGVFEVPTSVTAVYHVTPVHPVALGVLGAAIHRGDIDVVATDDNYRIAGVAGIAENAATGTTKVETLMGGFFTSSNRTGSTSNVATMYGVRIRFPETNFGTGTVDDFYGLHIQEFNIATNNYGIFEVGPTANIFQSPSGFGSGASNSNLSASIITMGYEVLAIGRNLKGGVLIGRNDQTIDADDLIGEIVFWSNDTQQTATRLYAKIECYAESTITSDQAPGRLLFLTAPATNGAAPVERLRIDSTGKVTFASTNIAASTTLFTSTADATVSNTTTETTLVGTGVGSVTIAANGLIAGRTIRVTARGIFSTNSPAVTLQLRVRLGGIAGTVVIDTGAQTPTASLANRYWEVSGLITCRTVGASGTVYAQGMFEHATAATTAAHWDLENTTTQTIDTTAAQAVVVSAQWGAGVAAADTITCTNLVLEALN